MARFAFVLAGCTLALASACAPRGSRPVARHLPGSSTTCAFGVPGVRVSAFDTEDGVDIALAVVGDPSELRKRARDALSGVGPYCLSQESQELARRLRLRIDDTASGLVIHATPVDPQQRREIRAAVHRRVEDVKTTTCD